MTKDQFISECSKFGYCNKKTAIAYSASKEALTADDFIAVHRLEQAYKSREAASWMRNWCMNGRTTYGLFYEDDFIS